MTYEYSGADYFKIPNNRGRLDRIEAAINDHRKVNQMCYWPATPQGHRYWSNIEEHGHDAESLSYLEDMKSYFISLNYEFAGADYSKSEVGTLMEVDAAIEDHKELNTLFWWSPSPQGHNFWKNISRNGHTPSSLFYLEEMKQFASDRFSGERPETVTSEETVIIEEHSYDLETLKSLYESSNEQVNKLAAELHELKIQKREADQEVNHLREQVIELGVENADLSAAMPEAKIRTPSWWSKLV